MIEAIIKDDQGAEIWRWAIEPPADTIAKEETLPFTASFSNMPDEADSLHLHMVLISDAPRIEHVEEAVEHETPADQHEAPVHESHH